MFIWYDVQIDWSFMHFLWNLRFAMGKCCIMNLQDPGIPGAHQPARDSFEFIESHETSLENH